MALPPSMASAQQGATIVRDAETEALLQDYIRPIFNAAGVRSSRLRTFLVVSDAFNAFVVNGRQVFVNTGTIIDAQTPGEIIGVLAHETAHLAHNDEASLRAVLDQTKAAVLIATLLGMGAAIAGSLAGAQGATAAGTSILSAAGTVGARSVLAYRRVQESAADRSAVDYLNATGQSGAGFLATLNRMANDNLFLSRSADPYLQSHPMPRDRVVSVEHLVTASKFYGRTDPADLQRRHDLVRAKLAGFTWTSGRLATRYPASDTSLPGRYARAISAYRYSGISSALRQIDALIATDGTNPYFWELKGQALLETGNPKAAVDPLRRAVALAPSSALIKTLLGQALVATDNNALAKEAISLLSVAIQDDPDAVSGYRALARAYDMAGNTPLAQLTTAEGLFAEGNIKDAKMQATRAQGQLKTGSPAWLRAADIVAYNPPKPR